MKYLFMSVVILLSVAVCIIIWKKPDTNFYERTIMTFTVLGVMANLFVVINIYYQTDAISQQTNAVEKGINLQTSVAELENRPFLHAVIRPVIGSGSGAETGKWFGPAELDMKNTGRTPATIIGKPEFKVGYDQVQEVDLEGWFKKEYGDFPHVTAVFPGQTSIPISLHPDLGSSPKIAYVWSKIIYTGAASRKKY